MTAPRYRPDIDGLRAIAVLGVVFFHVGAKTFSGGYIGVDVFFVISGFLITRLINDGIVRGDFSFSNFYLRRARRLFPALFFTLVATLSVASVIFLPQDLERFGGALLHSILSVSNFYFWGESGYFDTDAHLKPLLHTWSLSVEEQFYFVWPTMLSMLVLRGGKKITQAFIVISGGISLYLSVLWVDIDPSGAFYLLPFRVFEFAFGAIMVWLVNFQPRNQLYLEPILVIGLVLVLFPMVSYTSDTVFPGLNAVVPCFGTALLIYSGMAKYAGRLLSNRPTVAIGMISYSLYLIHWPIIVFFEYYFHRNKFGFVGISAIVTAAILCATVMYFFVEKPFRRPGRNAKSFSAPAFGLGCALSALLLTLPAAYLWAKNGWVERFPDEVIRAVGNPRDKRDETWKLINADDSVAHRSFTSNSSRKILVVGDSHSKDVFNALYLNSELIPHAETRQMQLNDSCLYLFSDRQPSDDIRGQEAMKCKKQVKEFLTSSLYKDADVVVLSSRWSDDTLGRIPDFVGQIRSDTTSEIVLLGRTAEFDNVPDLIVRNGTLENIDKLVASRRNKKLDALNQRLLELAKELDIPYLDKVSFVCSEDRLACDALDEDGNVLFYDYGHWTLEGAKLFGKNMIGSAEIKPIIGTSTR